MLAVFASAGAARPHDGTDAVHRSRQTSITVGLAVAAALAGLGVVVAHVVPEVGPLVGSAVSALLLGLIVGTVLRRRPQRWARVQPHLQAGIDISATFVLQCSVVLLGAQLSLDQVARVGLSSLPVMLATLTVCGLGAATIGRMLGVDAELRVLIGSGTAICGASAIAAVSAVTKPRSASVSYALTTIFCFNVLAVLLYPPLGHLLHLNQAEFGLFAGTAVNDTSSVVAASTAYGAEASQHAVVVKLVRSLMIIPLCVGLTLVRQRKDHHGPHVPLGLRAARLVPWFLIGFVLMAAFSSAGLLTAGMRHVATQGAGFGIAMALAAIGLTTDVAALRRTGGRPLLLGAALWVLVAGTSLSMQLVR